MLFTVRCRFPSDLLSLSDPDVRSTKWLLLIFSAGYLVLEGYGGPGESSTDDDILASTTGKQLRTSQGCAADSGINLRFSSTSQAGSLSTFSRQVLSHLRNLQANLNYLKVINSQEPTDTHTYKILYLNSLIIFIAGPDSESCISLFLLQEVEAKYNNLIRQRPERSAADTDGNKGNSIHDNCQHMND